MMYGSWALILLIIIQYGMVDMPRAYGLPSSIKLEYEIDGAIHSMTFDNKLSDLHLTVINKSRQCQPKQANAHFDGQNLVQQRMPQRRNCGTVR